jgi:hypothetical protein
MNRTICHMLPAWMAYSRPALAAEGHQLAGCSRNHDEIGYRLDRRAVTEFAGHELSRRSVPPPSRETTSSRGKSYGVADASQIGLPRDIGGDPIVTR